MFDRMVFAKGLSFIRTFAQTFWTLTFLLTPGWPICFSAAADYFMNNTIFSAPVISPQLVREQIALLLQSSDFRVSPRIKNILLYIVEETLQGRAGNLKAYSIAMEVLDRDARFDPSTDPIVRVEMGKLRRQLELYYILNPDSPVYIKIPKGSYAPVFKARHAGAAEYVETFKQVGIDPGPEIIQAAQPAQRLPKPLRTEIRPILAVLPFEYRGMNPDMPEFARGLTQSILVELAYMHDVDSRDASLMNVEGLDSQSQLDLGQSMGARFALHGMVQPVQSIMRIYVALTDISTARRIWTEKYDLDPKGNRLLDVQDEITKKIVGRIADEFGLINQFLLQETRSRKLDELGMYEASLRYNAWIWTFDKKDFIEAQKALEHCYSLYPDNVMVLALLSDIYSSDYLLAYNVVEDCLDRGMALAQKALSIDSTHQAAQWSLALNHQLRGDLAMINNTLGKIYPTNNVNPFLYLTLGIIIGMTKDMEEGRQMIEEALAINPHSPSWCRIVPFMCHYVKGEYEQALGEALHVNLPACVWDPIMRAAAYAKLGRMDDAKRAVKQLVALEPEFQGKRKQLLYAMLVNEKYVKMLDEGLTAAGL